MSVTIIAGDMQAVTEVSETVSLSETAQGLMNSFEDAMAIMGCADTESGAYDNASAAFEEQASSQLEELGFDYEITSEGVSFSRSGTAVEEYGPATRTGAAPFLGLTGTVEVGSLDQVIDVSDYKGLHRCPVLVCPKSKVKKVQKAPPYYKFCANPSKFQVNARHFCGVHKLTFQNHPDALKEGRIFDCETDVVVCSRAHGMGLAYPLQDAHVKGHCERVGANPGMKMKLPFNLGPTSKDQDLLSIVRRAIPDFGVNTSASGEQAGFE
jgi:hypothetical protein